VDYYTLMCITLIIKENNVYKFYIEMLYLTMFQRVLQSNKYIFTLYFLVSLLVFYPLLKAHFVVDTNSFFLSYIKYGWGGLLNIFNDASVHIVQHYTIFFIWKIFGLNVWAWQIITLLLHAFCAYQIFRFFIDITKAFETEVQPIWAFLSGFIFLIHPLTTETIAWSCCIMYIQVSIFCILVLRFFLKYNSLKNTKDLKWIYFIFFIAVFTWELAFTLPFIVALIWYFLPTKNISIKEFSLKILLPMLLMVALFFVLNKITRHNAVGHYGAAAHLNTNPLMISFNMLRYGLKYLFIHQLLSDNFLQKLMWNVEGNLFADPMPWLTLCIASILVISIFLFKKKMNNKLLLISLMFLIIFISILPILNIWPVIPRDIQQDRYLYYTLCLFVIFLVLSVQYVFKKWYWIPLVLYISLGNTILLYYLQSWKVVGEMAFGLVEDFRWYNKNKIYILSNADNVNGAFAFVNWPISAFAENLITYKGKDLRPNVIEIAQLQHTGLNDSIQIQRVDEKTLLVKALNGKYFYFESFVAKNYENDLLKVNFNDAKNLYIVVFKKLSSNDVIIYQNGNKWNEIKL
jgi:hypothetical protein